MSQVVSAAPPAALGGRLERKYILPAYAAEFFKDWLDHACAPDPRYAHNVIRSLYYDTPWLDAVEEKRQSTFYKHKVRLRWYTDEAGRPAGSRAFLELKRKAGARTFKKRKSLDLDLAALQADPIAVGNSLDPAVLLEWPLHGAPSRLLPVCVIRYVRRRYVDMTRGARIALDYAIGAEHPNPAFYFSGGPGMLEWAVLEVKGPAGVEGPYLPPGAAALAMTRASFSKYAECVRRLLLREG
ncbi:MAG: VTC domain-containing protein [Verrucomicrobia bacterium]|nr:VTC domain-containing protein [Verrucomicrobiota bacterium]